MNRSSIKRLVMWLVVVNALGYILITRPFPRIPEVPLELVNICLILFNLGYVPGSFRKADINEIVFETFFGKLTQKYGSGTGLIWAPFGLYQLRKFPTVTQQFQIPGEPEKVFKGDDEEPLPQGMMRAIRIPTGQEAKIDPGDPLTRRLVVGTSTAIAWRIYDGEKFYKNIGSIPEAQRQMRDTVEKMLTEKFGKISPSKIIATTEEINKDMIMVLQRLVEKTNTGSETKGQHPDSWGVEIEGFQLLPLDLSHDLSKKISDATGASYDKVATIEAARGDSEAMILKGDAKAKADKAIGFAGVAVMLEEGKSAANARQLFLEAEAKGYKALAKELGIEEKEVILKMKTLEAALANNPHLYIGTPDIASIADLLKSVK